MTDPFHDRAADYDARPVPQQISEGVGAAIAEHVSLSADQTVIDFGAGTGLIAGWVAPHVGRVLAVDISPAMLERLVAKPELQGKVEVRCQDILQEPLGEQADVIVSAMAAHHVRDTAALLRTLHDHLVPGGTLALADLDTEPGTFHPPDIHDVHHHGFDRQALAALAAQAGFQQVSFTTAVQVHRDEDPRPYPVFLMTARRAG